VTNHGDIVVELFEEAAPISCENFRQYVEDGFFAETVFHRVIPNFMIQGGDPTGTGQGGPAYRFEDEFDPQRRHDGPGVLSMANSGPRTNGSQFFITHVATPHLDDRHTVFGRVVSGQDVVDSIRQGDKIKGVSIEGDTAALKEQNACRLSKRSSVLDGEAG
jgi:peptidyl-prolyl cis-trans isomerase B (cyclophilin B)